MQLSGLSLAAILLFSSVALAQHSSGGGGGGGGSSAGSSGGGSHGGGSPGGGSSYSGGGHSSGGSGGYSSGGGHSLGGGSHTSSGGHGSGGGSARRGSGSGGSTGHGSNSAMSTRSGTRSPANSLARPVREPGGAVQIRTVPEKRTFFSFLRHPFRKPEPKTVIVIRRPPFCLKGPCRVCPVGQVRSGGGCVGATVPRFWNVCSYPQIWNGGECLSQTLFIDTCSGLRMFMERQAQRMQAAQSAQQSACAQGQSQDCSDATATSQSEERFYQSLQERYRQCRLAGGIAYSFRGNTLSGYGSGLWFDPFSFELEF